MTSRSRSRSFRCVTTAGAGLALSLLLTVPATARARDRSFGDDDQIVLTGTLEIASDETVDSAAIFNGSAVVDGTVRESLFVLNGDADISGTVRDDVVVVNGDVVVHAGARIGGDLVTSGRAEVEEGATVRGERRSVVTRFDVKDIAVAGRFAWWVGYSVSVLILGLLLLAFAPRMSESVRTAVSSRRGASIGWGAGLFFLLPVSAVVLLVSVVGIPLGIFVLLGLALIYTLGYTVAAVAVGGSVMKPPRSRYVVFLVGLAIVRVLALIPFIAGLVWLAASAWGLGVLALTIRTGTRITPMPAVPPMPPAPAVG